MFHSLLALVVNVCNNAFNLFVEVVLLEFCVSRRLIEWSEIRPRQQHGLLFYVYFEMCSA